MRDLGVGRQELLVGEIGPEQQQRVAGMHCGVAGGEADKAGHADIVRIVELDMLLAAERMYHRALQGFGELHQAFMRAGTAAAAEQRHAPGIVQKVGKRRKFGIGRPYERPGRQQSSIGGDGALGRCLQGHVTRENDDGDAALSDRGAYGIFQDIGKLVGIGDQLTIMAAFAEQVLRMGLLKVAAADLAGRDLCRDRQHRRTTTVSVEQAVDEMQIARAA